VADRVVRGLGFVGGFERISPSLPSWTETPGWAMLFPGDTREATQARTAVEQLMVRLPAQLLNIV
jgi:hypothetical protein